MNERLARRMKEFGIPRLPYQPIQGYVVVFRIPPETKTAGGLWLSDTAKTPKPYGVLCAWGPAAADVLASNGCELGDIVWFAKYSGWEEEIARDPENQGKDVLLLEANKIRTSVDLVERIEAGETEMVRGPDGRYVFRPTDKRRRAA